MHTPSVAQVPLASIYRATYAVDYNKVHKDEVVEFVSYSLINFGRV